MFLNLRKSKGPDDEGNMALPDNVRKKGAKGKDEDDDGLVQQITNLEGLVSQRTRDLEQAKNQLHLLYKNPGSIEEIPAVAEAAPGGELTVEPDVVEKKSAPVSEEERLKVAESLLENVHGGEASAPPPEPPREEVEKQEPAPEVEKPAEPAGDDFFASAEEEEHALSTLIAAMPDVNIDELLRTAEEVKTLVQDWLPKESK